MTRSTQTLSIMTELFGRIRPNDNVVKEDQTELKALKEVIKQLFERQLLEPSGFEKLMPAVRHPSEFFGPERRDKGLALEECSERSLVLRPMLTLQGPIRQFEYTMIITSMGRSPMTLSSL